MKRVMAVMAQVTFVSALVVLTACNAPDDTGYNRTTNAATGTSTKITTSDSARPEHVTRTSPRDSSNSASTAAEIVGSIGRNRPENPETTGPTVLVSGTVTYDTDIPITSATV